MRRYQTRSCGIRYCYVVVVFWCKEGLSVSSNPFSALSSSTHSCKVSPESEERDKGEGRKATRSKKRKHDSLHIITQSFSSSCCFFPWMPISSNVLYRTRGGCVAPAPLGGPSSGMMLGLPPPAPELEPEPEATRDEGISERRGEGDEVRPEEEEGPWSVRE